MELIKQMSFAEMKEIGTVFAESGMFADAKAAAQAIVKIHAGQEIGIPPFAAMSGIHIIQGKPAIGAGLMASCVKASGKYDYKVVESTEKICSIDFYQAKEKLGNSTFTDADAKKAQTKNMDKYPKNMLFARALSNGVKWFTPDVFSGPVYTPEELGEVITQDIPHEVVISSVAEIKEAKRKTLSAKAFNDALVRLYAGEPELADKLSGAFELTTAQIVTVSEALSFFESKSELYQLLNSGSFEGNEFADAKKQIDACNNETTFAEIKTALLAKQPA